MAPTLPLELLSAIARNLADEKASGLDALTNFARTSKAMNYIITPLLYKRIIITRRNANRLFRDLLVDKTRTDENAAESSTLKRLTKREWDTALQTFAHQYDEVIAKALQGDTDREGKWPRREWLSDPETDDDHEPAKPPPQQLHGSQCHVANESPSKATSDPTLQRRLELFAHCTHLTVVQVPTATLCHELLDAIGYCHPCQRNPNTALFPNLTHLSLSPRVVRLISFYGEREKFDDPRHPFGRILRVCGEPRHACMTGVPFDKESAAEFFFRHGRCEAPTHENVVGIVDRTWESFVAERGGRLARVAHVLPSSLRSLTVHNVRYPGSRYWVPIPGFRGDAGYGLPSLGNSVDCQYRYFYDQHPRCTALPEGRPIPDGDSVTDTVQERAQTVAAMLKVTAPGDPAHLPTFEHVDVANNIEHQGAETADRIWTAASAIFAEAPAEHTFATGTSMPFIPGDWDPELVATAKAAEEAYERLASEKRTLEHKRLDCWDAEHGHKLAAAIEEKKAAQRAGSRADKDAPGKAARTRAIHEASAKVNQVRRDRMAAARLPPDHPVVTQLDAARATKITAARQSEEAADAARERRRALLPPAPPFEERVKFVDGAEAQPCVVCGLGHRDDWDLTSLTRNAA